MLLTAEVWDTGVGQSCAAAGLLLTAHNAYLASLPQVATTMAAASTHHRRPSAHSISTQPRHRRRLLIRAGTDLRLLIGRRTHHGSWERPPSHYQSTDTLHESTSPCGLHLVRVPAVRHANITSCLPCFPFMTSSSQSQTWAGRPHCFSPVGSSKHGTATGSSAQVATAESIATNFHNASGLATARNKAVLKVEIDLSTSSLLLIGPLRVHSSSQSHGRKYFDFECAPEIQYRKRGYKEAKSKPTMSSWSEQFHGEKQRTCPWRGQRNPRTSRCYRLEARVRGTAVRVTACGLMYRSILPCACRSGQLS